MALPMVHLLCAHAWAKAHEEALCENKEYYLGALAPDAVHMRENWDRKQKRETHLDAWSDWNPQRITNYWAQYPTAFDRGYGVHVLADLAWTKYYRENHSELLDEKGKTKADIYYSDCDKVDYILYREEPFIAQVFHLLEEAPIPEHHPLLSAAEIDGWMRRVVHFFDGGMDLSAPPQILTRSSIGHFIQNSPALMMDILNGARLKEAEQTNAAEGKIQGEGYNAKQIV